MRTRFRTTIFSVILLVLVHGLTYARDNRGVKLVVKDRTGGIVGEYTGSRALLIGVSRYTAGWPNLESIPREMDEMQAALSSNGFWVEKVLNPTADQLKDAFETFINRYGFNKEERLLFVFSGHGYTRSGGQKGYLVPSDAPDPRVDETGFLRKALDMGQILSWSRRIEAKHVLFLFDSCFSGTIFKTRALGQTPPHISDLTSKPVRQFITAGAAGEEVPSKSVFAPSFIKALRGEGDMNRDGYVTGTELGMYLHDKVLGYRTGQSPQYGKIRDPELDEGDFVFQVTSAAGFSANASANIINFGGYQWEILNGTWKVDKGQLIAGPAEENHILLKIPYMSEFTMELTEEYISGPRNSAVGHNWAIKVITGGLKRFRHRTSDVEGYGFNRTFNGLFNLFIGSESGWYLIEPTWNNWQRSDHLDDKTRIKITAKDNLFKIYGNNILITQFVHHQLQSGTLVLYAGKNLQVRFSDFKLNLH